MIEQPPPTGISVEDWTATPAAVRGVVLALLREVAELQERVNKTSRNSSKPPSSDPPHAVPRSKRSPSGRKRGGQKGRKGHRRRLKAPEEVNRVVVVRPDCCAECGALLLGEGPQPVRHQITELPPVKPEVIEYQQHTITCLACGAQNRGEWPAEMPTSAFGPRVQATVGYLAGRGGMSQREVQEVMGTVLHTEMGLGTVSALEQQVSEALAEPVEEVQCYLREQTANNVDETSWREGTQRTWWGRVAAGGAGSAGAVGADVRVVAPGEGWQPEPGRLSDAHGTHSYHGRGTPAEGTEGPTIRPAGPARTS